MKCQVPAVLVKPHAERTSFCWYSQPSSAMRAWITKVSQSNELNDGNYCICFLQFQITQMLPRDELGFSTIILIVSCLQTVQSNNWRYLSSCLLVYCGGWAEWPPFCTINLLELFPLLAADTGWACFDLNTVLMIEVCYIGRIQIMGIGFVLIPAMWIGG
jgi:hypothetical protein